MKLTKPEFKFTGQNALGHNCTTLREHYLIEDSDIGKKKEHYLGHRYSSHIFKKDDVGKEIETIYDRSGYYCWYFINHYTK